MRIFAAVCVVALLFGLGLALRSRTDAPLIDGKAEAVRNDEVPSRIKSSGGIGYDSQNQIARGVYGQLPRSWIPVDAEREHDQGALLTWIATDAEREDDQGAFLTWTATDAERNDDHGPYLTWTATDAERDDDIGVKIYGSGLRM